MEAETGDVVSSEQHPQHGGDVNSNERTKLPSLIGKLYWVPPRCRWDTVNPPPFTLWLNILFAVAGGFTTANLYYSHPILNVLARDFGTTQAGVSTIPTLAQAGDATGLLFILPLADFFPRRKFTLTLIFLSASFWVGLCITSNFQVFLALTYLSALFTGATQIMLPLVAELSTPERRALNISIVGAGPSLAILLARILSGIITNYTGWRNVYWLALGLQGCVLSLLFLFMPDYPATNPTPIQKIAKTYPKILWSIIRLFYQSPVLVQSALLSFCTFFALNSYWTTLTFLLSGSPYHYSSTIIGLFGLVGAATMVLGPLYSKYIIQPLKQPLLSVLIGKTVDLIGIAVGTYAGTYTVAGPVIQALLLDAGLIIVQISNRVAIHDVSPLGRNRVNTAFVTFIYLGQLTGTKAGNTVYEKYGGWIASGSLSVGVTVLAFVLVALRGPHEPGWIGWSGGWGVEAKQKPADPEVCEKPQQGTHPAPDARDRLRIAETVVGIDTELALTANEADVEDGELRHGKEAQSPQRRSTTSP